MHRKRSENSPRDLKFLTILIKYCTNTSEVNYTIVKCVQEEEKEL